MEAHLIEAATGQPVTIAGEVLADGRALVQYVDDGKIAVRHVNELEVVGKDGSRKNLGTSLRASGEDSSAATD